MQTNEEAAVYVYDLDFFLTVQILGDTSAVLSLGDSTEDITSSPATIRRRSTSSPSPGNLLRDLPELLKDFKENLVDEGTHPQALLVNQIRNLHEK